MKFEDKYVDETEFNKGEDKDKGKKVISDDAFAIGEMIEGLINKLENLRISINTFR